jgi:hypothetical protein
MGKTLTIVARGPGYSYDPARPEGDDDIQAVCDMLKQRANGTSHCVEHAVTLSGLRNHLVKHPLAAGDRLQIIGHGSAGKLLLGQAWGTPDFDGKVAYVLDSTPRFHGVLMGQVQPGVLVWLIGCCVGAELEVGSKRIADGPTLLFDLARMWNCEVAAPVDTVRAPEDFDEHGIFAHASQMSSSTQQRVQSAKAVEASLPSIPGGSVARIEFTALYGLPVIQQFGFAPPLEPNPLPLPFNQLQQLGELSAREVDGARILAGAELLVSVSIDGQPEVRGEFIVNLRVVRARTQTGVRYFELGPAQNFSVSQAVSQIVDVLNGG